MFSTNILFGRKQGYYFTRSSSSSIITELATTGLTDSITFNHTKNILTTEKMRFDDFGLINRLARNETKKIFRTEKYNEGENIVSTKNSLENNQNKTEMSVEPGQANECRKKET